MTVSSTSTSVSYTGDASTTSFPVSFAFFGTGTDAEIRVIERVIATGVETTLTNGTNYTVTGGSGSTGTVVAASAPAATKRWTIERATTRTQETDYVENDPFPAEIHEQALDRLTMIGQEAYGLADRSVKFPASYTGSVEPVLPEPVAGKAIGWNSDATALVNDPADFATTISTVAASATAAANSATSASSSATNASNSATAASDSASTASTQATNASNSAIAAATSETNAANSASAAQTAETNAETAETNAETAQAAAELAQASAEAAAAAIFWNFDTTTSMADPGTGGLRLDNATVASVTAIAVSALAAATGNPDVSDQIVTWDDSTNTNKGTITIRKAGAPATFAVFTVSGAVTDNTTWLQIAVTHVASNGALSAGDDLYLSFSRAGDKGADGAGSGDMLASAYPTLVSLEGLSLAAGDILYATAADTLARLPKGSDGEVLMLASGVPDWAAASGGSYSYYSTTATTSGTHAQITNLDSAYDHIFVLDNVKPTGGDFLACQVGTGSTPTWVTTGYNSAHVIISSGVALSKFDATDASRIVFCSNARYVNATYGGASGEVKVGNLSEGYTKVAFDISYSAESSHNIDCVKGAGYYWGASTAITAIRFFFINLVALNGGAIRTYRRAKS